MPRKLRAPLIALPRFAVPLLDGVRRIGEDYVEGLEPVAFDQSRIMQGVAAADIEVGHAVQHKVHAGDGRSDVDELLPVETDGAGVAAVTFHLGQARDEHAAGAAGRVVDGLTRFGFEHLGHQVHERAVGVELLRGVARVVSELLDEVLVAVAEFVFGHVGETQGVL